MRPDKALRPLAQVASFHRSPVIAAGLITWNENAKSATAVSLLPENIVPRHRACLAHPRRASKGIFKLEEQWNGFEKRDARGSDGRVQRHRRPARTSKERHRQGAIRAARARRELISMGA